MRAQYFLTVLAVYGAVTSYAGPAQRPHSASNVGPCVGKTITANITFTGLMTFVDQSFKPDNLKPIDPMSATPDPMTVVLPDVTAGGGQVNGEGIMPHVAAIVFDSKYLTGKPTNPVTFVVIPLNGDDIFIDPAFAKSADNPIDYTMKYEKGICPTKNDKTSLYWMPRLLDLLPTATQLSDSYLPYPVELEPEGIAGRLDVTYGALRAEVTSKNIWDFKAADKSAGPPIKEQAIAQLIHWSFSGCDQPALNISLQPFGAKQPDRVIALVPVDYAIEAWIENVPYQFVLPDPTANASSKKNFDPHFAVYNEAVVGAPTGDQRVVPFKSNVFCTPPLSAADRAALGRRRRLLANGNPSPEGINCGPDHVP